MNNKYLCLTTLILLLFSPFSNATNLEIVGSTSYQTSTNLTSVTIKVDKIINNENGGKSGTVHLRLWATTTSSVFGNGFLLADANLSTIFSDSGRLSGGSSFVNITYPTKFTQPPAGKYYIHLYVSEFPDLNTVRDHVTYSNQITFAGDNNNTIATADTLPLDTGSFITRSLSNNNDVDYYKVIVINKGILEVVVSADFNSIALEIRNTNGSVIGIEDSADSFIIKSKTLEPGTYYIKVFSPLKNSSGEYRIDTQFVVLSSAPASSGGGGGGSLSMLWLLTIFSWRAIVRHRLFPNYRVNKMAG